MREVKGRGSKRKEEEEVGGGGRQRRKNDEIRGGGKTKREGGEVQKRNWLVGSIAKSSSCFALLTSPLCTSQTMAVLSTPPVTM